MTVFRLPFFAQESPLRRAYEWTILAENWWPHDGRKLTGGERDARQVLLAHSDPDNGPPGQRPHHRPTAVGASRNPLPVRGDADGCDHLPAVLERVP